MMQRCEAMMGWGFTYVKKMEGNAFRYVKSRFYLGNFGAFRSGYCFPLRTLLILTCDVFKYDAIYFSGDRFVNPGYFFSSI